MSHFQEMLKLDDDYDIVMFQDPFCCLICLENIASGEGVILRDCLHNFCK